MTDKTLEVAELRQRGMTYPAIARHLSISLSTAHYRYTRVEQADPVPFFRAWVRVLCAAGLRIDEACRALRCDVDLIAGCLRVGRAKTDAGVRSVQLTPETLDDIERYLTRTADHPASGPLLPTRNGTHYDRTSAGKSIIKALVEETDIVLAERVASLPAGSDPAALIQRLGAAAAREAVVGASAFARFCVQHHIEGSDLSTAEAKDRLVGELRDVFIEIPPSAVREDLLALVAKHIGLEPALVASWMPMAGGTVRGQPVIAQRIKRRQPPSGEPVVPVGKPPRP